MGIFGSREKTDSSEGLSEVWEIGIPILPTDNYETDLIAKAAEVAGGTPTPSQLSSFREALDEARTQGKALKVTFAEPPENDPHSSVLRDASQDSESHTITFFVERIK